MIVAGDFNGDGHLDLAVSIYNADTASNQVSILPGKGDGTFGPPVTTALGFSPASIVAGDYNGDGKLDLAIVYGGYSDFGYHDPGRVTVLLGNGDGSFGQQVSYTVGPSLSSILTGDFNGDGHLDLAVVDVADGDGYSASGVTVLLGYGDGTFKQPVSFVEGPIQSIVAGDFNGDGRLDLAVANNLNGFSGILSVLLGNGDGSFETTAVVDRGGVSAIDRGGRL